MIELAISSWTVHGLLGQVWYELDTEGNMINQSEPQVGSMALTDLPAFVAADGFRALEICNFHLPSIKDDYLRQLRKAQETAGVTLVNLLIDTGNLAARDEAQWRLEIESAKRWQDVAAKLGAHGVRLDCGTEQPSEGTITRSSLALRELADYGASIGLESTTENWRETSVESDHLLDIMSRVERPLRLCLDFGNAAKTSDKYATMKALLPRATSLHCKGNFDGDSLDIDEFHHSLSLVKRADFSGQVVLIENGTENEWERVLILKQHVEQELLA